MVAAAWPTSSSPPLQRLSRPQNLLTAAASASAGENRNPATRTAMRNFECSRPVSAPTRSNLPPSGFHQGTIFTEATLQVGRCQIPELSRSVRRSARQSYRNRGTANTERASRWAIVRTLSTSPKASHVARTDNDQQASNSRECGGQSAPSAETGTKSIRKWDRARQPAPRSK